MCELKGTYVDHFLLYDLTLQVSTKGPLVLLCDIRMVPLEWSEDVSLMRTDRQSELIASFLISRKSVFVVQMYLPYEAIISRNGMQYVNSPGPAHFIKKEGNIDSADG